LRDAEPVNDPARTPPEPEHRPSPPSPSRLAFLGAPERLALAIYGVCLVLVLVLYHFQ